MSHIYMSKTSHNLLNIFSTLNVFINLKCFSKKKVHDVLGLHQFFQERKFKKFIVRTGARKLKKQIQLLILYIFI